MRCSDTEQGLEACSTCNDICLMRRIAVPEFLSESSRRLSGTGSGHGTFNKLDGQCNGDPGGMQLAADHAPADGSTFGTAASVRLQRDSNTPGRAPDGLLEVVQLRDTPLGSRKGDVYLGESWLVMSSRTSH